MNTGKPKISAVYFDWGGVVADDPGDDFLAQLLERKGALPEQIKQIHGQHMSLFMRGKISESEYWKRVQDKYGLVVDDGVASEFLQWSGLVRNQDIIKLVRELRDRHIVTAVLSNVIEPTYRVLEQSGSYAEFDAVIASCRVGYAKPEREIYQLALDALGVRANEALFIDDKQRNLDVAQAMGFRTILALDAEQIIRDTRKQLEL